MSLYCLPIPYYAAPCLAGSEFHPAGPNSGCLVVSFGPEVERLPDSPHFRAVCMTGLLNGLLCTAHGTAYAYCKTYEACPYFVHSLNRLQPCIGTEITPSHAMCLVLSPRTRLMLEIELATLCDFISWSGPGFRVTQRARLGAQGFITGQGVKAMGPEYKIILE